MEDGPNRGLHQRTMKTHHHHDSGSGGSVHATASTTLVPLGRNYKLLHGNQGTVLDLVYLYDTADRPLIKIRERM